MKFDAVIFDIDNVLIDTRASYTDAIRKTVETYLIQLGFRPSRHSLLSRPDVEQFKTLGGFNDDWDTCYGLLLYLLSLKIKRKTIHDLNNEKNIKSIKKNPKEPFGPTGAEKIWGKKSEVSLKKIADIFQNLYLNDFMWNEKLFIPKPILKYLRKSGLKMGIVTGRNREEADFVLRRFQIDSLMDAIITTDETPNGRKKPDPWGLLKVSEIVGKKLKFVYVGDLPDDILAAEHAKKKINISSIGYLAASEFPKEMERELKRVGADFIVKKPKELLKIIEPTSHSS